MDCFAKLPTEIFDMILSYLKYLDRYFLAQVFPYLQVVVQNPRYKEMDLSMDYRLEPEIAKDIFAPSHYLESVTYLNLNGIYWIKREELIKYVKRMKSVERIWMLGTTVTYNHILNERVLLDLRYLLEVMVIDDTIISPSALRMKCKGYMEERCISYLHFDVVPRGGSCTWARRILRIEENVQTSQIYVDGNDWDTILHYSTVDDFRITENKAAIVHAENINDENTFEEFCTENSNAKELILRNRRQLRYLPKINLIPITQLKFLHTLNMELFSGVYSSNFLEHIFEGCHELRRIKIATFIPQFQLTYFKHAKKLEDISFNTTYNFQVDKFFLDLQEAAHLKLKRIKLRFNDCKIITNQYLDDYFEANPQLVLFYMICNITLVARRKIQRSLKRFTKSPKHLYFIKPGSDRSYYKMPLIHMDMFRNCCCTKHERGVVRWINYDPYTVIN